MAPWWWINEVKATLIRMKLLLCINVVNVDGDMRLLDLGVKPTHHQWWWWKAD